MRYLCIFITMMIFIMLFAAGCSRDANPLVPLQNQADSDLMPVVRYDNISATGLFGVYCLSISPDFASTELVPMRNSAIGESYIVSGAGFFTVSPCVDCLKIKSIALDENGNAVLEFKVKHPFEKGDPLKPPTAVNRLDLDVFDLALVIKPIEITPDIYTQTDISAYTGIMKNADGFTCELSDVVDDDVVMPYKICYEDENNNRFEMGTDYQLFDVILSPGSGLLFDVYLTMGYGASAKKPERLVPTYYVPEFNRKAAWKVEVIPPEGDNPPEIGNTWDDVETTVEYTVTVDIYDWNHGAVIATDFPDSDNTNHIYAQSDVGAVTVEIPGMTSSIVAASTTDTETNGWDDPLTYTAEIANENALLPGLYTGLVKVTDSRIPGYVITGGETDTLVHSPDGINLAWHKLVEFATYQTFTATVVQRIDINGFARTWGGTSEDTGQDIAVDDSGNIYITGTFCYTVDFDPGNGVEERTAGGFHDTYLLKLDRYGDYVWVETSSGGGKGITLDNDCNVYVTGNGLCKYDSNGNNLWTTPAAGAKYQVGVDSNGNSYVIGDFYGTHDFNPDPIEEDNRTPFGITDVFMSKFDSDGTYVMTLTWGGSDVDKAYSLAVDGSDNIITSGHFGSSIDLDPGIGEDNHNSIGMSDVFVSKFDSDANFIWGRSWGGTWMDESFDVDTDSSGNILIGGWFYSTADFDPGTGENLHSTNGNFDVFLTKFDQNGIHLWAQTFGAHDSDRAWGVAFDNSGNAFITGYFYGNVDFDTGPDECRFSSKGHEDCFLSKFDADGNYQWARAWGGIWSDMSYGVATNSQGCVFATGIYQNVVDFNPCAGVDEHTSNGSFDAFLLMLPPDGEF